MPHLSRSRRNGALVSLILLVAVLVAWISVTRIGNLGELGADVSHLRTRSASAQLISVEPLPETDGQMCELTQASASATMREMIEPASKLADDVNVAHKTVDRPPSRTIHDSSPTYSAIALDLQSDEVFLEDENLFGIKVFNRMDNTAPGSKFTEPKRLLGGKKTKLEFNCGLYIDPKTGDLYSVNNDTTDLLIMFPHTAQGDVAPTRELHTPHGTYGIAVDEQAQEMYLTVEHTNSVVVYKKGAQGEDKPLRKVQGGKTLLADPHGIGLDVKDEWMFVTNHGNYRSGPEPSPGKFLPPSIEVFPLKANGDVAPIRTIQGSNTQLDWPAAAWIDEEHGEVFVANDAADSILVFKTTDDGDVAPTRVIKGSNTQIKNPTGVFLDTKHDEVWISNMGNHRATVFDRAANGNAAPKRVIRSAPADKLAQAIGNPGAVGYDSKREEILVPN